VLKVLTAALAVILTVALFWPGYMSVDSLVQLEQARYGIRDSGHPPLLSLIWRVADKILPGPGGMLALQAALYWCAVAMLAPSAPWMAAGLLPPLFGMAGVVWKDVWMCVSLLAAVGCLASAWPKAGLVLLLAASGFRHNGIAAVIPLLWPAAAALARPRRRTWSCFLVLSAGFIAASHWLTHPPGVPDPKLWRLVMAHDLAGMSLRENRDLFPPGFLARHGLTLESLRRIYVPYQMDPTFSLQFRHVFGIEADEKQRLDQSLIDADEMRRVWLTTVLRHPLLWAGRRMEIASRVLVWNREEAWSPVHVGIPANALGVSWRPDWRSRWLEKNLNHLARQTPLYQVWIYCLILLAAAILFRRHALIAATAWSGLLSAAVVCAVAGSTDYRYMLWTVAAALAVCLLAAGEWRRAYRQSSSSSQS